MSAKTGTTQSGAKRWYSIKINGATAKTEKFIDSYLEASYPRLSVVGLDEAQKLALLSEAVINCMTAKVAEIARDRVRKTQDIETPELMNTELSTMLINGED